LFYPLKNTLAITIYIIEKKLQREVTGTKITGTEITGTARLGLRDTENRS
jgi:hypothetical protein